YQLDPAKTTLFQDKRVRQALLYAINRPQIVKTLDFNLAKVAVGTIPPISWAYNPDGIKLKYDYDVDKAKQLLDEAGWKPGSDGIREKDGKKLSFSMYTTSGGDNWVQYMQVFQQEWKQLGVELTPKTEELNALLTRFTTSHDFESVIISFGWGTDPDQTTMWSCAAYPNGYNTNKYCNPQVDKLLADALKTTDHGKRRDLYTQMENILMDDLPSVILDFPNRTWAVNKRVHNLYPNAVNFTFDSHKWWVDA
ncbi:MAG TPA: ABC transporter substrate-binding protein, partial [Thermomicrobiaceae bacterium]|nr:ABC transporter substrate-binding protein [Thermomicrobiaceae bacterium]